MTRSLSAAHLSASQASLYTLLTFVELALDAGTIRLHTGVGTYTWGGQSWYGVGDFGDISEVEEGPAVSPYDINLVLSGLNSDISDGALSQNFYLRPITIYVGALDADMTLVADPDIMWQGKIDNMQVLAGSSSSIRLTAESDLAIFDKTNGARFTDQALQALYPGDLLAQYMSQMEDARIVWRGDGTTTFANGGGFTSSNGSGNTLGGRTYNVGSNHR